MAGQKSHSRVGWTIVLGVPLPLCLHTAVCGQCRSRLAGCNLGCGPKLTSPGFPGDGRNAAVAHRSGRHQGKYWWLAGLARWRATVCRWPVNKATQIVPGWPLNNGVGVTGLRRCKVAVGGPNSSKPVVRWSKLSARSVSAKALRGNHREREKPAPRARPGRHPQRWRWGGSFDPTNTLCCRETPLAAHP